jgi:RecB family endonuclease NucS
MPLFELADSRIGELERATFEELGIRERYDLQRLLRKSIHVIDRDIYVIDEEFGEWEDAKRRIDLLCLDRDKKLVVVELKRSEDGGHMELQALRYAAMISTLTFEKAVETHSGYLSRNGDSSDLDVRFFSSWASLAMTRKRFR